MYSIRFISFTHEKIVGFEVSVHKVILVHQLKSFDELESQFCGRAQREFVSAKLEQTRQSGTQEFHRHVECPVVMLAKSVDFGNPSSILYAHIQIIVLAPLGIGNPMKKQRNISFIDCEGVRSVDRLQFDCYQSLTLYLLCCTNQN